MIYLNGTPLNVTIFPDNTSQVWQIKDFQRYLHGVSIEWSFSSEGEFLQLAQLKDLLDSKSIPSSLYIKYLPYGRQDKIVSNDTTFALSTFARLLNSLKFERIMIMDPHSDAAVQMIDNAIAIHPMDALYAILQETTVNFFCYPDKGALNKYSKIYDRQYIYGEKVRDQQTGKITSYYLAGDPKDKYILIVDDICDGGATFVLLAKRLHELGAKEVNLFVTHGIFSKGLRPLKEAGINRIFTQDGEASEVLGQIAYRRL